MENFSVPSISLEVLVVSNLGFCDCIQTSYHILYSIFIFSPSFFQQKSCSPSSFHGKFVQSLTGNTPQFIRPISPNPPIIRDIFKRSPLPMSIVHVCTVFLYFYIFIFFIYSFFLAEKLLPSSFRGKFVQSLRSHATASWPQREIWGGEKWPQRNEQRLWKHCQSHKQRSKSTLQKKLEQSLSNKVLRCTLFIKYRVYNIKTVETK